MKINTSLAAPGALAHRLQRRIACKIQNGHQGPPKWPTGSGNVSIPRFLGAPVNFHKIFFFDLSTPSMRKGDDGETGRKYRCFFWSVERPNADRLERRPLLPITKTSWDRNTIKSAQSANPTKKYNNSVAKLNYPTNPQPPPRHPPSTQEVNL